MQNRPFFTVVWREAGSQISVDRAKKEDVASSICEKNVEQNNDMQFDTASLSFYAL